MNRIFSILFLALSFTSVNAIANGDTTTGSSAGSSSGTIQTTPASGMDTNINNEMNSGKDMNTAKDIENMKNNMNKNTQDMQGTENINTGTTR